MLQCSDCGTKNTNGTTMCVTCGGDRLDDLGTQSDIVRLSMSTPSAFGRGSRTMAAASTREGVEVGQTYPTLYGRK